MGTNNYEGEFTVVDLPVARETVSEEAERLVGGDRLRFYGPPIENFRRIAKLWSAYLDFTVNEQDVCAMMILLKQARLRSGGEYHRDSVVDTVGYARLQEILDDSTR